jgi:hypothetical protein
VYGGEAAGSSAARVVSASRADGGSKSTRQRGFFCAQETNPANQVRNIRVIMPGFENTTRRTRSSMFLRRWQAWLAWFMD